VEAQLDVFLGGGAGDFLPVTKNGRRKDGRDLLTELRAKGCEVVRSKACAFLEFKSVDSAKRAIIASLHPNSGGDGGVKLDEEKYGSPARVTVETRKERADRPGPRLRGGTPIPAGEGRGGGDKGTSGSGGPAQQGQGGYRGRGGNVRGRGDGGRGGKA